MSRSLFRLSIIIAAVVIGGPTAFGQPSAGTNADSNVAGQITGSERFLRANREMGQVVGATTAGIPGFGTTTGQTGTAGTMSQFGSSRMFGMSPFGMGGMGSMYTAGMMNAMANQRRQLRIPLRLGTDDRVITTAPGGPATPVANARLQTRLASNPRVQAMGSVAVMLEGRTAVLTGSVASEHDRQLLPKMLLLEPGISDVRNELQIAAAPKIPPAPKP